MTEPFKPASPVRSAETARFWDAAGEGKLLVKQCVACDEFFHHPRDFCPFCLSDSVWAEASGDGVIYSHSQVHLRDAGYVLALVSLSEGPTIMSNILTDDPSSIAIGQKVRVRFIETDGEEKLPVFVPA